MKIYKKCGGGGSGWGRGGGQGRCDQRSEVFLKIQKKNLSFFLLGGGGGVGSRRSVWGGSGWI